jgi:hypothetical protein
MLLEPVAHVFPAGVLVLVQQALGRDDEARRAETALGPAMDHPGLLQRMQVARLADALDGLHLGPVIHALHLGHAGADHLAVHDHAARAALALAAADLGPGQAQ